MNYPDLPPFARRVIIVALVCGSLIVLWRGVFHGRQGLSDFAGYYTASRILVRGDSVHKMYDDAWFVGQIRSLGLPDTTMIMYVNPPPVALVMVPLSGFMPETAKFLWNGINLLLMGAVFLVGRRLFEIPRNSGFSFLFGGMCLATIPFLRNLQRGQVYAVMLLLVLLLFQGILTRNTWLTVIPLAVLILLKYFGWMFFLLLIASRRWKEFLLTLGVVVILAAGMILCFGIGLYEAHIHRLFASFASHDLAITHLPAISPFWGGFFVFDPLYNPFPLFDAPSLARILTIVTLLALAGLTIRYFLKSPADRLGGTFAGFLTLSVIATPLAAEHHYLLLVPVLWYHIFSRNRNFGTDTIISCAFLMYLLLGWFPAISPPITTWYAQLLAYPHLYGALLLWGGLIGFVRVLRGERAGVRSQSAY